MAVKTTSDNGLLEFAISNNLMRRFVTGKLTRS